MRLDIELFFCEKFEKYEHHNQGGYVPVERHIFEGVDQTVQGIAQFVRPVAVNKSSVADH
jgi:hypothetical protein